MSVSSLTEVRSAGGRQVVHSQANQQWHSWTCTLGFPVMGIWQEGNDGTDINSVCCTRSEEYIVRPPCRRNSHSNYPKAVTTRYT
eukprot:1548515-Pyramimonas_sp.AAC.1